MVSPFVPQMLVPRREARSGESGVARHGQALRRLLRRQPLCGIGVQSLMPVTSMPACWIERMAVSRPERALDLNVDLANAVLHGGTGGLLGGHLGREGSRLAGALEADVAGGRPGDHVTALIGDRDDRVVERALDVRHAVRDVLALTLAGPTATGEGFAMVPASSCPQWSSWDPCAFELVWVR